MGNNMFAYCGNNPLARADSGGAYWHLVIGRAILGALWNTLAYLSSTDEITVSGIVGAVLLGAFTGALGGFAGIPNINEGIKWGLIVVTGMISGTYAELNGGSLHWGFLTGVLGTYSGTLFSVFDFDGWGLAALNFFYTFIASAYAELTTVVGQAVHALDTPSQQHQSATVQPTTNRNSGKSGFGGGSHQNQFSNRYIERVCK